MGAAMDALEKCELFGNTNPSPLHTHVFTLQAFHTLCLSVEY